jgi:hypothetical protein
MLAVVNKDRSEITLEDGEVMFADLSTDFRVDRMMARESEVAERMPPKSDLIIDEIDWKKNIKTLLLSIFQETQPPKL